MRGIMEPPMLYRKHENNPKDIKIFNKNLAEALDASLGEQDKEPMTAYTIAIGVDDKKQPKILNMLQKHEHLRSGNLRKISTT